jgi:hypothetical protein
MKILILILNLNLKLKNIICKINIPPGPTGVIQFWGPYNTLNLIKD